MAETGRLPAPVVEHWDWQRQAACREMDTRQFFHPLGERGDPWRRREEAAKRVCQDCPVRQQCLEYSLQVEEPYGTWGGVGERERREIVRRHRADRRRTPEVGRRRAPRPVGDAPGR